MLFLKCDFFQVIKPIQKPQASNIDSNPYEKYGAGAESKMRLEEAMTKTYKQANTSYYATPIPEARMRTQEQSRYVSPEIRSREPERRHVMQDNRRPTTTATINAAKNPFDDDEEQSNKYDEAKNPFADDDEEPSKTDVAKETSNNDKQTSNPFGEYDDNSNPFD